MSEHAHKEKHTSTQLKCSLLVYISADSRQNGG